MRQICILKTNLDIFIFFLYDCLFMRKEPILWKLPPSLQLALRTQELGRTNKLLWRLLLASLNLNPKEKKLLKAIYKFTGINYRYSVLSDTHNRLEEYAYFSKEASPSTATRMAVYKQNALPLALAAINDCLSQVQNFNIENITHLITIKLYRNVCPWP